MKKFLFGILMQLMTEKFIKEIIIKSMEWIIEKTKTEKDNEMLDIVKKNWGL